MKVLVFNCGSSSVKFQLFSMPGATVLAKGMVDRIGSASPLASQKRDDGTEITISEAIPDHQSAIAVIQRMLTNTEKGPIRGMNEISACGHRVVHGGETFSGTVLLDDKLEKVIEEYFDLAPLHNPPNLTGILAAKKVMPGIPQAAVFDTSFHQTIPPKAYLYALPYEMYEKFRIRKYGFHGTSHRYVAERAALLLEKDYYTLKLITCHLGNGCSITAVLNGQSIDTSMGFTPLEGVVMGTRSGDFDPAVIFYLLKKGYSAADIDTICNKKSGLSGISGISNDVRDLEKHASEGNKKALLALDIFAYRIKKYIGAYIAVLNGAHGIIFTGGIGENGVMMRRRITEHMENLGIIPDLEKNRSLSGKEAIISSSESKIPLMIIPTNEEKAIAHEVFSILK